MGAFSSAYSSAFDVGAADIFPLPSNQMRHRINRSVAIDSATKE